MPYTKTFDNLQKAKTIIKKVKQNKNIHSLQCTCYSASFCSEGNYYLVRNDCPIHKGKL